MEATAVDETTGAEVVTSAVDETTSVNDEAASVVEDEGTPKRLVIWSTNPEAPDPRLDSKVDELELEGVVVASAAAEVVVLKTLATEREADAVELEALVVVEDAASAVVRTMLKASEAVEELEAEESTAAVEELLGASVVVVLLVGRSPSTRLLTRLPSEELELLDEAEDESLELELLPLAARVVLGVASASVVLELKSEAESLVEALDEEELELEELDPSPESESERLSNPNPPVELADSLDDVTEEEEAPVAWGAEVVTPDLAEAVDESEVSVSTSE